MSRWHKSWCDAREGGVRVRLGGVPHCLTCLRSPDVAQLLEQLALEDPRLRIPTDEPPGKLNLAWPPTVPYLGSRAEETTSEAGLGAAISQLPREPSTASTPQTQAAPNTNHPPSVYPQTLRPDQIRLLVLDSRDTPSGGAEAQDNWPVHVELQTYNDDDCPEYETVSYVWGGEDGDSSPCRPVYVGRLWDVLFQTKNCYEMLRLLRPLHGIRFLWVDALCINQNDLDERTQQVAKMAFIYGHALRVILYLGPDMVTPLPPSSYPTRRRLEDLAPHSAQPPPFPDLHLRDLLERRYFSRIWVVQELLLAKQVLARIRDVDFVADHRTSPNLLSRSAWDWADTPAPWLAHISQGIISPAELLRIGISREASDRRDNVFGVLGLLRADLRLVPDYSISAAHARIGFAAHCLLQGDAPDVLLHPGPRNASIYPSWVPWPALGDASWRPGTSALDKSWREMLAQSHTSTLDIHTVKINDVSPEPDIAWHRGAHVDPATGSLDLQLVHLMAVENTPLKLASSDGFTIMELSKPNSSWRFHLVFQETPHELDLRPGDDHIFILDDDTNPPSDPAPVVLVMRRVSKKRLDFQLVACCHQVYISCSSGRGLAPMHHPKALLPHRNFLASDSLLQIVQERRFKFRSYRFGITKLPLVLGMIHILLATPATVGIISAAHTENRVDHYLLRVLIPPFIWVISALAFYLALVFAREHRRRGQPEFKRELDLQFELDLEESERKLELERKRKLERERERVLKREREPAPKNPCLRRSLLEHIRVSGLGTMIRREFAVQNPDVAHMLSMLRITQGILNDERGASPSFVDTFLKELVEVKPIATSFNGIQCVELHVSLSDFDMVKLVLDAAVLAKASPACRWRRGPVWDVWDGRKLPWGEWYILSKGMEDGGWRGPEVGDFHPIAIADMYELFNFADREDPWMAPNQSSFHALLPVEALKECYRRLQPTFFVELRLAGLGRRLTVEGGQEDDELSLFLKWAPRLPEEGPLPHWAREDPDYGRNVPDWDPDVMEFGVDGSTYKVAIV